MKSVDTPATDFGQLSAQGTQAVLNGLLSKEVSLPQPVEVSRYLERHSDLASVLPDVVKKSAQSLGPQFGLRLEVYKDPESSEEYLTLYVRSLAGALAISDPEALREQFTMSCKIARGTC